jgi:two-component sensor histidine kinase
MAWEERRAFRTQLAWLQNGVEVREWVIRVQPPHHPPVQVACHVSPARDTQGRLIGFRWLLRDLTAQQQVQETIAQQVRELTMKLEHANDALQAMRDRAELRGRELHHRMKNHLQVVASLLDGQAEDLPDPSARAIFEACQGRIRAMALIHELLHRPGDSERIELGHYLRRLAVQVFQAYGVDGERVHLTLQADAVIVDVNTAMPCGLLVHELLTNCVQHAFPAPQAGDITITLRAAPVGQVTLTIRDTGIGLPADVDVRQAESFGLHLLRGLTEQLQGTLVFTRDGATCVMLRFPI